MREGSIFAPPIGTIQQPGWALVVEVQVELGTFAIRRGPEVLGDLSQQQPQHSLAAGQFEEGGS